MKLYHFSDVELERLEPKFGERRHAAEDSDAKDIPVIYLTDDLKRAPGIESFGIYRHTVEVDENDPFLSLDKNKENLKKQWEANFGKPQVSMETVYFYTKSLIVESVVKVDTSDVVLIKNT
jgi:hypothetical protein